MAAQNVVTCFLEHGGKVLLLRRSQLVGTFRGRWAGVSGSIPPGVDPLAQALLEIEEETGLAQEQVELLRHAEPLVVEDEECSQEGEERRQWRVHPFLFRVAEPTHIRLNWEHTEMRWVAPEEMRSMKTVPGLWEAWQRLWTR
jgi:ADP-ribose pyrophosphatase YjhB (NUDIX family)